jgi:hypothetical protein
VKASTSDEIELLKGINGVVEAGRMTPLISLLEPVCLDCSMYCGIYYHRAILTFLYLFCISLLKGKTTLMDVLAMKSSGEMKAKFD